MINTDYENLENIIQGCIRKSEKHREALYKKYFGYALSVAMLYNRERNDAIEIVDDSFLKVFLEIGRFDTKQPFKGWLRKIVINTSIDKFRKKNRELPLFGYEEFPEISVNYDHANQANLSSHDIHSLNSMQPGIISQLTANEIIAMLNSLPEIHKTIFCLYEIEGFSHEEIGGQMNIPASSSRVYLTRAKKRLRELYQAYYQTSQNTTSNTTHK